MHEMGSLNPLSNEPGMKARAELPVTISLIEC
jgi:hypothetical protein